MSKSGLEFTEFWPQNRRRQRPFRRRRRVFGRSRRPILLRHYRDFSCGYTQGPNLAVGFVQYDDTSECMYAGLLHGCHMTEVCARSYRVASPLGARLCSSPFGSDTTCESLCAGGTNPGHDTPGAVRVVPRPVLLSLSCISRRVCLHEVSSQSMRISLSEGQKTLMQQDCHGAQFNTPESLKGAAIQKIADKPRYT